MVTQPTGGSLFPYGKGRLVAYPTTRVTKARNRLGNVCCHHSDDKERVAGARRELAYAKIMDFIEKTLSDAPALTPTQNRDIVALLRAGGGAG